MSRKSLLDDAITKAKEAEDWQLVEWLRMARGGEIAARWYTAKLRELESEDAKGRRECHNASCRLDESRFHCSECGFGCWVKDVADGRDHLPRYCPSCGRKVVEA